MFDTVGIEWIGHPLQDLFIHPLAIVLHHEGDVSIGFIDFNTNRIGSRFDRVLVDIGKEIAQGSVHHRSFIS